MTWLVTGAAGYIGSHLLRQPGDWIALDSLATGRRERVPVSVPFEQVDITDRRALDGVFERHAITGVIHLAALKSVPESLADPDRYEHVNVGGTRTLLESMRAHHVDAIVFGSSAAVYGPLGAQEGAAITESALLRPANPYGQTKLSAERLIEAHALTSKSRCAILRVFNVAGLGAGIDLAAASGGVVHAAVCAAAGNEAFAVLGSDYPTADGTCVRDYVHVEDVAQAFAAAAPVADSPTGTLFVANVGTGRGTSVLGVVDAVRAVTGRPVPVDLCPPRTGDVPVAVAAVALAREHMHWEPRLTLSDMVESLATAAQPAV